MGMKKRIFKWIAFAMAMILALWMPSSHKLPVRAAEPKEACFEDNRFRKFDGSKYIRIKDVTRKGATVILYDWDLESSQRMNSQPGENQILFEMRFGYETLEDDFQDDAIEKCIEERLVGTTEFGRICLYLSPDGTELYVRDETGEQYGVIEGGYVYDPYVDVHLVDAEWWEQRIAEVDPATMDPNKRGDLDYRTVGYRTVRFPDQKRVTWEPFDEGYWQCSLLEILQGSYVRFEGYAWVESAVIESEEEYADYHINRRKPWKDSEICDTDEDKEIVIATRKEQFLSQEGERAGRFSFAYDNNAASNTSYTELFLERDVTIESTVNLSWGSSVIGYFFDSIEWNERGTAYPDEIVFIDQEKDEIVYRNTVYPEMHYTGGIAYRLDAEIHMYWNNDGTIGAIGKLVAYGEGTEVLTYAFTASAVDYVSFGSKEPVCKWIPVIVYRPRVERIPGEIGRLPIQKAYRTELVKRNGEKHYTLHNDWPDDTDQETVPEGEEEDLPGIEDPGSGDDPILEDDPGAGEGPGLEEDPGAGDEPGFEDTPGVGSDPIFEEDPGREEELIDIDRIEVLDSSFIGGVYATSELKEGSVTHKAEYLIDGDWTTAWVEGVAGCGEGETISFKFAEDVKLVGFEMANGYFKSQNHYDKNGRIVTIFVEFGSGETERIDLISDGIDVTIMEYSDLVLFDRIYQVSEISFTIVEAIPGERYEDTCITEITFLIQED